MLAEARDLIALVKRRGKEVTEAFYDIGEACLRLSEKAMVAALGRRSFAEVALSQEERRGSRGKTIVPKTASAREIERAAKAIRQATNAGKPRRGKSTTEDERTLAKLLERRLHELGFERASVEAVATKAGHVGELRFAGIPVGCVDVLKKAIGR